MEKYLAAFFLLILLFGCASQPSYPNQNTTQPATPANPATQTNPEQNFTQPTETAPTLAQLKGCAPGLSFAYWVTTNVSNSSSKALLNYTTEASGITEGGNIILKTIKAVDLYGETSNITTREWESSIDCSCVRRETVVEYGGKKIFLNESCPRDIGGSGSAQKISFEKEESVLVPDYPGQKPAYSGTAKLYRVSYQNDNATYLYWLAPGFSVPVKTLYSIEGATVLEELFSYG